MGFVLGETFAEEWPGDGAAGEVPDAAGFAVGDVAGGVGCGDQVHGVALAGEAWGEDADGGIVGPDNEQEGLAAEVVFYDVGGE